MLVIIGKNDLKKKKSFMQCRFQTANCDKPDAPIPSLLPPSQAKEAEKMRERAEKKKSPKPVRKLAEPERVKLTSPKHASKKTGHVTPTGKKGFSKTPK